MSIDPEESELRPAVCTTEQINFFASRLLGHPSWVSRGERTGAAEKLTSHACTLPREDSICRDVARWVTRASKRMPELEEFCQRMERHLLGNGPQPVVDPEEARGRVVTRALIGTMPSS